MRWLSSTGPWTRAGWLLAWLCLSLGWRTLALPDEGRYAGVAWEMVRSGDWLVPTLNGLPYFHKPPLFYWITAASLELFGVHPWAVRLAPLCGACLACVSLYLLMRRRVGESEALAAVLTLVTTPFLLGASQYANLDMLVAGCISAAICAAADAVLAQSEGQPHRRQVLVSWAAVGLGVLAKGLIGIVLPGAVIGAWLLLERRWRAMVSLLWWPGPVLALAIAGPWFWAMQLRFPGFLHYFFVYQHFQRFAEGGFNNARPFWFYIAALPLACLPASAGLLGWRRLRLTGSSGMEALTPLLLIWIAVILLFFSMPRSKLIGYALPALPPFAALLSALWWARWGERVSLRMVGGSALLCLGLMGGLAWRNDKSALPLAVVLKAEQQQGEPLLYLGVYPFDLPMLIQDRQPQAVAMDWASSKVKTQDSWPKEIRDAGEFAPELARQWLIDEVQLRQRLCQARVAWVVHAAKDVPAWLAGSALKAQTGYLHLRRVDLSRPEEHQQVCAERPTGG